MKDPDFFLSTAGEYAPLSEPRACCKKGRLSDSARNDYMLIEIDPPLFDQRFGIRDAHVTNLLLSTRYEGYTLYPISEWPSHVYVMRVLDDRILTTHLFTKEQVELIAWGLIFRTLEEAQANVRKVDGDVVV